MPSIKAECDSCGGTGVYCGMCEAPGEAVVCLGCGGSGQMEIRYKEFTGRKRRKNVKRVFLSQGRFIATGVGPGKNSVSYDDFLAGKLPTPSR